MYLTHEEYVYLGGTLDETQFINFAMQAEAHINHATFGRLKNDKVIPSEVRSLMKYLVDLLEKKSAAMTFGKNSSGADTYITSQSNDGVSVSYSGIAASDFLKLSEADIINTIRGYLDGVKNEAGHKLLYRGLYPGE